MGLTAEEIKALPRTEEGLFDLSGMGGSLYEAAEAVYPVYAAYETDCNKKEGYPDIMAQMRILYAKSEKDFTFANAAAFLKMLLHTLEKVSPEIYENYRELADMFRTAVKRVLTEYYVEGTGFRTDNKVEADMFCDTVKEACDKDILLAEKYQMCF